MIDRLALRLHGLLTVTHRAYGLDAEPLLGLLAYDDVELHEVSPGGVLAFVNDYVLAAWPPDESRVAGRAAYRLIQARLRRRGFTRHMVHPLNFTSVKVTRKLGAVPIGVDDEGFVHYVLLTERFPHHGQEVATAESAGPDPDQ